jgi:hypothetical protein
MPAAPHKGESDAAERRSEHDVKARRQVIAGPGDEQRDQGYAAKELLAELGTRFSAPISRLRSTRAPTSPAITLCETRPGRSPLADDPMDEAL